MQPNVTVTMISDLSRRVCYPVLMSFGHVKKSHRVIAVRVLMIASLLGLLLLPPIPQDQNYHDFADQRTLLGIPHFWNVVSNIPFVVIGAAGLWPLRRGPAIVILFLGILLTGFGSAYYHLDPDDSTLFWGRLPMAVIVMSVLAIGIQERVDAKAGAILLWPLIATGVFSLYLWRWTGDLRLYAWVQFFPCLMLPLLFLLFPPKYTGTIYWLVAAAFFALAKLCGVYDEAVYSVGSILSGHAFKHVAAAAACFTLLRYFQTRRPITAASHGMKTRNRNVAKTTR